MKANYFKSFLVLAALVTGANVQAQSKVPGPQDYAVFSQFIADRNIFDPSRQPHSYSTSVHHTSRPTRRNETPGTQLVGVMTYEKGPFAFFNGNSSDLRKALQVGGVVAGYTVTRIQPYQVVLESADKKNELVLKIGEGLRQENGKWVPSNAADLTPVNSDSGSSETTGNGGGDSGNSAPAAPASASEPNDILKRLMQQREKENQ